ncbi:MAG: hydantoinase/oxoprolinase family protein [Acidimicrobiia bacterium]|nr:hydantoinase/oxoprolinase family protein [bacterium]MDE0644023.1 hydantoinase/oxoprolinase family protein [bacterium]MXX64218.1 hydantoinase/oxoprolinase family protein [Acidimicrobiia bacterium]MYD03665.1 hydantoinase/oxoprolinase family protein [Acidimicrobiia bacterium]MYH55475.1 hydantoinase/oxoprolinase family protein [Acidimicrobiia bacterium]
MGTRIGVDIGGTFTDLVLETESGTEVSKVLTTPEDLVEGVLQAVDEAGADLGEVDLFIHGTTVGLNTFLERSGGRVALVTTRGYRDAYLIGRGHRPDMYDLKYQKPTPLVQRDSIFEVDERITASGEVLTPLDSNSVEVVAKAIAEAEYEAVAVSLIHSYVDPLHELEVKDLLKEHLPDIPIILSHEVAPEWREYERTSSTVTSVYITPRVRDYLSRLSEALRDAGLNVPLHITQSNGGAMIADSAADRAVLTLYSGPVGGVIGGRELGRQTDQPDLICIDMGGTSFDVSIVRDGQVGMQSEFELQGLPILAPAVELVSIGAGGGSLIYERNGGLRVGPESAGSFPGPACYGRGGVRPTVSDANVVLGRIPRSQKLAGSFTLDRSAAEDALESVAEFFDLTAIELAEQALEVTHFVMAEAIRELTIERGLHPKDFAIVAFGGAGPLHAAFLAEELEVGRVLIPSNPGVFSAWGMLQGDVRHDAVVTHYRRLDQPVTDLTEPIERLKDKVCREMEVDEAGRADMRFETHIELRYVGQEYSLPIVLPGTMADEDFKAAFHDRYNQRYGHSNPEAPIEMVAIRLTGILEFRRDFSGEGTVSGGGDGEATEPVIFDGRSIEVPIVDRNSLAGRRLVGPAIVVEPSTTTVVPPGWELYEGAQGHLIMEQGEQE